jgi:hypothetical protein
MSRNPAPLHSGIVPHFERNNSAQKRDDGNEMMLLASLPTKFLTDVGHIGDHSRNQRRFAPTLPHFTGIGAPLQRNPQHISKKLFSHLDEINRKRQSKPS